MKTRASLNIKTLGCVLLCTALLGCAEDEEAVQAEEVVQTQSQHVVVVPTFQLDGLDALPDSIYLTRLGLTVSEIRLEPMAAQPGTVAFSAVKPEVIRFNLAENQLVQTGQAIELPKAGRYLVSIRLEPLRQGVGNSERSSFTLQGFVAQESMKIDPRYSGGEGSNQARPTPVPVSHEKNQVKVAGLSDTPDAPETWTSFRYHAEYAVFFPLNDVEFKEGSQELKFHFDVTDWASAIAEPVARAVQEDGVSHEGRDGIDVTKFIEGRGQGAESFLSQSRAITRGF